jgi:hypothetical protein
LRRRNSKFPQAPAAESLRDSPKLVAAKMPGTHTVLVLENADIALADAGIVGNVIDNLVQQAANILDYGANEYLGGYGATDLFAIRHAVVLTVVIRDQSVLCLTNCLPRQKYHTSL